MDLISILNKVINAKRIYRDATAADIVRNPELLPELIAKVYDIDDPLHIKAAWVLELVYLEDGSLLDAYIHEFIRGMPLLNHESALRPISKVCSLWSSYYFSKKTSKIKPSQTEVEIIISCNFDWLIESHKTATQVFAMDTLKLWSSEQNWIQPELKSVLQKNADLGTSGYRTHARKLLKNL
ncbi:hypothetical protein [Lutimonas vermicola]|uniref:Adenylosuccinate lyase n=1 Tax=Lutimonas vermicola TaxID=414288 RepID=A0ABU9KYY8_9FLAO